MKCTIYLDLDGTVANLYSVPNWLEQLRAYNPKPYEQAKCMHNMSQLAKLLHKAQRNGYQIGIISWLSKDSNPSYDQKVKSAKQKWLAQHLPSVVWDKMYIVPYGQAKSQFSVDGDILFDDELPNRKEWTAHRDCSMAFEPSALMTILKNLS